MSVKGLVQKLACNAFSKFSVAVTVVVIITMKTIKARKDSVGSWELHYLQNVKTTTEEPKCSLKPVSRELQNTEWATFHGPRSLGRSKILSYVCFPIDITQPGWFCCVLWMKWYEKHQKQTRGEDMGDSDLIHRPGIPV